MSLVRVTAVGICGSDLHWWDEGAIGDAKLTHPLVLGHEGAGVIADGPRRGERVAIDPAIPDETCRACRDGYRNLCYRIRFSGHGETDGMLREVMAWPSGVAASRCPTGCPTRTAPCSSRSGWRSTPLTWGTCRSPGRPR